MTSGDTARNNDMRWAGLQVSGSGEPALFERQAVMRTFDTPGFRGMSFYEIHARSIINEVSPTSHVPFRYTINPYRGCSHGCRACFARNSHTYLDFDSGQDFDSQVVVKVNAPGLVRKELSAPKWRRARADASIAVGTNVDCYQRAEGRYQLMPGILSALRDFRRPFSVLTRGPLILRDLELIGDAAQHCQVGLATSVPFVDPDLWRGFEPGAASPAARLKICAAFTEQGLDCGVLMAPILPYLSDSPSQLENTVRQIAEAGARSVTPIVLHLRPGAREWFLKWLGESHPALVPRYQDLYRHGAYAPKAYQRRITERVKDLARRYGIGERARTEAGAAAAAAAPVDPAAAAPEATQLSLL